MPADEFDIRVHALTARIKAEGEWVSLDGRIRPPTVAKLVGRAEKTLRSWRAADKPVIPYTLIRGTVTYAIADVLRYIDGGSSDRLQKAA